MSLQHVSLNKHLCVRRLLYSTYPTDLNALLCISCNVNYCPCRMIIKVLGSYDWASSCFGGPRFAWSTASKPQLSFNDQTGDNYLTPSGRDHSVLLFLHCFSINVAMTERAVLVHSVHSQSRTAPRLAFILNKRPCYMHQALSVKLICYAGAEFPWFYPISASSSGHMALHNDPHRSGLEGAPEQFDGNLTEICEHMEAIFTAQ